MAGSGWRGFTWAHARRMVKMVGLGVAIFTAFLLGLQLILVYVGIYFDPTFYLFYPIMAGLGAVFGFERWWAQEQGGVNPFHDR